MRGQPTGQIGSLPLGLVLHHTHARDSHVCRSLRQPHSPDFQGRRSPPCPACGWVLITTLVFVCNSVYTNRLRMQASRCLEGIYLLRKWNVRVGDEGSTDVRRSDGRLYLRWSTSAQSLAERQSGRRSVGWTVVARSDACRRHTDCLAWRSACDRRCRPVRTCSCLPGWRVPWKFAKRKKICIFTVSVNTN